MAYSSSWAVEAPSNAPRPEELAFWDEAHAMPIRVKSKKRPNSGGRPRTPSPMDRIVLGELPDIEDDDSFRVVVKKVSV